MLLCLFTPSRFEFSTCLQFEDGKWGNEEEMLGINPKKRVEICRDDNNDNDKNSREQQQRRLHKRHQSQKGTPGNVNIFHIFNQCKT